MQEAKKSSLTLITEVVHFDPTLLRLQDIFFSVLIRNNV